MVRDRAELEEICDRLSGKGITKIFVPGGDADPGAFDSSFGTAMVICAALLVAGGVVSWLTIRPGVLEDDATSAQALDGTGGPD
jgi:hypothetical protein